MFPAGDAAENADSWACFCADCANALTPSNINSELRLLTVAMWIKINLMRCAACAVVACAAPAATPGEEPKMSPDSTDTPPPLPHVAAKRRAPPKVPAVTLGDTRYEQAVLPRSEAGGVQRTGYVAAYKGTSDERLWRIRVYELKIDPALEGDVQDVYFATMDASPDGRELLIANELGEHYAVDVRTQGVRRVD